jgi:hypothetical protein
MSEVIDYQEAKAAQKAALEAQAVETDTAKVAETSEENVDPETTEESKDSNTKDTTEEAPEKTDEEILAESEASENEDPVSETDKHRSKAAEKRIARLIKKTHELEGQLSVYKQTNQPVYQPEIPEYQDPSFPNPANYPDGENDIDFKLDTREYQRSKQRAAEETAKKIQDAKAKYPDLEDLMEEHINTPVSAVVIELLQNSDVFDASYHYLLANPDELAKLNRMTPLKAGKTFGLIEAKLMSDEVAKTKKDTVEAPKKSTAPKPINPVKTTTVKPNVDRKSRFELY